LRLIDPDTGRPLPWVAEEASAREAAEIRAAEEAAACKAVEERLRLVEEELARLRRQLET
jgi:hypothetical protein